MTLLWNGCWSRLSPEVLNHLCHTGILWSCDLWCWSLSWFCSPCTATGLPQLSEAFSIQFAAHWMCFSNDVSVIPPLPVMESALFLVLSCLWLITVLCTVCCTSFLVVVCPGSPSVPSHFWIAHVPTWSAKTGVFHGCKTQCPLSLIYAYAEQAPSTYPHGRGAPGAFLLNALIFRLLCFWVGGLSCLSECIRKPPDRFWVVMATSSGWNQDNWCNIWGVCVMETCCWDFISCSTINSLEHMLHGDVSNTLCWITGLFKRCSPSACVLLRCQCHFQRSDLMGNVSLGFLVSAVFTDVSCQIGN